MTMTAKQSEERSNAKKTLEAIDGLRRNKHFAGYFLRRLAEKKQRIEQGILRNDTLTAEQMRDERVKLRFIENELEKMVAQDEAAARKVLGLGEPESDD